MSSAEPIEELPDIDGDTPPRLTRVLTGHAKPQEDFLAYHITLSSTHPSACDSAENHRGLQGLSHPLYPHARGTGKFNFGDADVCPPGWNEIFRFRLFLRHLIHDFHSGHDLYHFPVPFHPPGLLKC